MKSLIVCTLLVALVAAEWKPRTRDQMVVDQGKCFESGNLPDHLIAKIKEEEYPDETEVNCYLRCIMTYGGVWDDETGYNVERGLSEMRSAGFVPVPEGIRKCASLPKHSDPCRWAAQIIRCFKVKNYVTPENQ